MGFWAMSRAIGPLMILLQFRVRNNPDIFCDFGFSGQLRRGSNQAWRRTNSCSRLLDDFMVCSHVLNSQNVLIDSSNPRFSSHAAVQHFKCMGNGKRLHQNHRHPTPSQISCTPRTCGERSSERVWETQCRTCGEPSADRVESSTERAG